MSTNPDLPAATAASSGSTHPNDHVHLRVTYLQAGNPRPPHDLGAIPATTKIDELKSRLQQELLEHPAPEEQRLIYQGRPLIQNNATLREALRLEGPIGPLPYTIHVILQPRQAASHFRPPQPDPVSQTPQATGTTTQHDQNGQPQYHPQPHQPLQNLEQIQAMMQSQLRMIEQHMSAVNRLNHQPQVHRPPGFNTTFPFQRQPVYNVQHTPHGINHTISGMPNVQALVGQQQAQRYMAATQQPQDQNLRRPNQNLGSNGSNAPPQEASSVVPPNFIIEPPVQRPSSAPGNAGRRRNAQEFMDPIRGSEQVQQNNRPPQNVSTGLPYPPLLGNSFAGHMPHPFSARPAAVTRNAQQTTVWLASSRNGPEALLFAPGHGYFSSMVPTNRAENVPQRPTPHSTQPSSTTQADRSELASAPVQTQQAQDQAPAQLAVQQQRQDLGQAQQAGAENRNQNQGNDDLFALIVQRGWLFLRLYMFMFVLSEPGTWRRYFLLVLALIVCLLPRENPLNNLFGMARRHLDNLIGLPNPQPAARARDPGQQPRRQPGNRHHRELQQQRTAQDANATSRARAQSSSSRRQPRGAVNTTPEETAQRLLEEHRQRNPNILLDTFWRLEQAIALFLASLIPGVGEGQVAAREQQRRDREREQREQEEERQREEERRREADQAQTEPAPDNKSVQTDGDAQPVIGEDAASSSVEPRASTEEEGIRARHA